MKHEFWHHLGWQMAGMKPKGEPSVLTVVLENHGGVMWTGKGPQDRGDAG